MTWSIASAAYFLCTVIYFVFSQKSRKRLRASMKALESELVQAGDRARTQERRATEFFGVIVDIEKERDTWQRFYAESSRKASVAQAWLFRDLGDAVKRANAYAHELRNRGVKVKDIRIDPSLGEVLAEFGHPVEDGVVPKAPGVEKAQKLDAEIALESTPKPA